MQRGSMFQHLFSPYSAMNITVSNTTPDRMFSTVNKIKTYLRNTTEDNR